MAMLLLAGTATAQTPPAGSTTFSFNGQSPVESEHFHTNASGATEQLRIRTTITGTDAGDKVKICIRKTDGSLETCYTVENDKTTGADDDRTISLNAGYQVTIDEVTGSGPSEGWVQ
ncbi:MAG: hypothetical protein RL885_15170 [Planctomycetota bacterium]